MQKPIKIVIADDHPTLISGLKMCLESDNIHVVGTTTDVGAAYDMCKELRPDVLILDISFGHVPTENPHGLSGLDIIKKVISDNQDAKIIVFSQYDDIQLIEKCYHFGAAGFLPKSSDTTELLASISTVVKGEIYFSEDTARLIARRRIDKSSQPLMDELNGVEKEILRLKSLGKTELDIASELSLSKSTITKKVRDLKIRLSASSSSELIELAHKNNIVSDRAW